MIPEPDSHVLSDHPIQDDARKTNSDQRVKTVTNSSKIEKQIGDIGQKQYQSANRGT